MVVLVCVGWFEVYGWCWIGQQNQQLYSGGIMQEGNRSQAEIVNPLIKLVKQREDLYFQLFAFVNAHLKSSSNDLDTNTVFNKFISVIDPKHITLLAKEEQFVNSLVDPFAQGEQGEDPISKQMLRLSTRLIQILQGSVMRVRSTVFEDGGRTLKEFTRFKSNLNKIIKREYFVIKNFVEHAIGYCTNKYKRQFLKLKKYVENVQQGDDICFRELYCKQTSDIESSSPSPDQRKIKDQQRIVRKLFKKIDMEQHLSSTEQPQKKAISLKKTTKSPLKRKQKNKNREKEDQDDESPSKDQIASKLYKFYTMLDLNKKQFFQDYVYNKIEQEQHRGELLNKLIQRNKTINIQINSYVRKSINRLPLPIVFVPAKSSGDQRNESVCSKVSLRTSFVISKRKGSYHFDTSSNEKEFSKEKQWESEKKDPFDTTIKNINPRKRTSHSNQKLEHKSKKLFVVKAPMLFEEEIIPQAPITQTQWLQAPLTARVRDKKGENIRQKRKINVNPLENAFLPQNFRYPL